MERFNKYTKWGTVSYCIFLFGNGSGLLPEFLKGLTVSLSIILLAIGLYSNNHDISKIKGFKMKVLNKKRF